MGGGGMGGMKMGNAQSAELYPHLMSLPEMTPEHRSTLESQAHQRMIDGTRLMSEGLDALTTAATADDFARMQQATSKLREGVSQFETGLATHRAIIEGTSPRNEALQWLKQEMGLSPPMRPDQGMTLWGMGPFHAFLMFLTLAFGAAMIGMYFFKMRRAASLMQALAAGDAASPGASTATTAVPTKQAADTPAAETLASIETDCCPSGTLLASDESSAGLLPLIRRKQCNLKVVQIFQETTDVKTFRMVCCHGGPIPFSYLPGQFVTLTMPVGEKPIRRSYTISSSPTQGYYCEITVKREDKGQGSRYLHDVVKVGDELEAQAASGRFTFTGKEADSIVLIAGGVGITPMMSIARAMTDMGWTGNMYFIVAARDTEHFIFREELERLARRYTSLHLFVALSRMKKPIDGYASGRLSRELLAEWVPNIASKRIHICGAPPMMDSTKALLAELNVPAENIEIENFGSAQKPKPKSKAKSDAPAAIADVTGTATVKFVSSDISTALQPDESLLEAAERIDVSIDNACRVGSCGMCRIKILAGDVTQEVTDGLEPGDEEAGMILACQAMSTGNVSVEA